MKEYWVNVYYNGKHPPIYGAYHKTRELAIFSVIRKKPLYRIHVILK